MSLAEASRMTSQPDSRFRTAVIESEDAYDSYDTMVDRDERVDIEDDLETLISKLNVEQRIQYGAEKFLEALESDTSSIPQASRPALRYKVTDELASVNAKIRNIKALIESFGDSRSTTPDRVSVILETNHPPFISALNQYSDGPDRRHLQSNGPPSSRMLSHSASLSTLASEMSEDSVMSSRLQGSQERRASAKNDQELESNQSDPGGASNFWNGESTSPSGAFDNSGFRPEYSLAFQTDQRIEHGMEEMDTEVLAAVSTKARMALNSLKKAHQASGTSARSDELSQISKYIAELTRCLRLSLQVAAELPVADLIDVTFPYVTEDSPSPLKAACYRLYRYSLRDRRDWRIVADMGIEWLLIRTFGKANRQLPEVEQAIQLIRTVIMLPDSHESATRSSISSRETKNDPSLSAGLVRVLVSMAENPEDPFQAISLETLAELALVDFNALIVADGLRFILQAFEYGPYQLIPVLTPVLMQVMASSSARKLMPPQIGMGAIFSGFTNAYGTGSVYLERLGATAESVLIVLRSWSGLFLCCMNTQYHVKELVESLTIPVTEMREVMVDMLFDLFRIQTPSWYLRFWVSKSSTEQRPDISRRPDEAGDRKPSSRNTSYDVVEQYFALLLAVFVEAGLFDVLVELVEERIPTLSRKATLLIGELLAMSARLLPLKYAATVQTLPRLFQCAATLGAPEKRVAALDALSSISSGTVGRHQPVQALPQNRQRSQSISDPVGRGQRQVEQIRIKLGLQMDDRQFQSALVDSQVLYTKDHNKWNYDILMDIIEGPLLSSRRLEEAFRVSKFGRRLMTFFQPLYRRFSDIKRTKANARWVTLGRALLTTLSSTDDGLSILVEDKLLKQMVDCFTELDQYAGQPNPQPYFSRSRLENTLSYGYFEFVYVLSKTRDGIRLLDRFNFFTCFYHLSDLRSRDDIIRAIVQHVDLSRPGHGRIILSKALTSSYMHTRMFATQRLGQLLSETQDRQWALELLITQLYDPAFEVCEAAAQYLEIACENLQILETVVTERPILDHLGDVGQSLLMRFLSTSVGFSYLHTADYVNRELDEWYYVRNMQYLTQIELHLEDALTNKSCLGTGAPPNFYREITKTREGCQILRDRGHFSDFARFVRQHKTGQNDHLQIKQLKSLLWAIGNIGSTEGGLPFLEEDEVIEQIVDMAEHSEELSVRGTCFLVLGLISTTTEGCDILDDYGWLPTVDTRGRSTGICLPDDLTDFVEIAPCEPYALSYSQKPSRLTSLVEVRFLQDISDLGNYVLATQAMQSLARTRSRHRSLFSSLELYLRAMHMLSTEHYKQPVRAFVLDMFDIQLDIASISALLEIEQREHRLASNDGSKGTGPAGIAATKSIAISSLSAKEAGTPKPDRLANPLTAKRYITGFMTSPA